MRAAVVCLALLLAGASPALAQRPIEYRLTFPEPEHRWMQVEVTVPDAPAGPLELRMSRSSPGRYALHEFAKNVWDLEATDAAGRALTVTRPNPHQWDVAGHDGTVRVRYRIFGDRVDGTYLAIDSTHAHLNMPATLIWARGLHLRPARVTFVPPDGRAWRVATQLYPTDDPLVFTAPNFQYLMDSPAEFSGHVLRTFEAPALEGARPTIRVALHHAGTDAQADDYTQRVARIVAESGAVFGEWPAFENGTYTFLADYLPWASGDGMEHRNSTVLSSSGSLGSSRDGLLGTVAHEFFHAWNVERIRPRSLEPFDFEETNPSGELWLAEGVTSYYDGLILHRAGLTTAATLYRDLSSLVNTVLTSPGPRYRSAVEMSRLAPFVDAARSVDRTVFANTFVSYYTFGAALGLGLDLAIRVETDGHASLDDFMRAMWRAHGRPGGAMPGYVDHPYTLDDVRDRLAEVTGSRAFAEGFIDRHVRGREPVDYAGLLARAGLVLRPVHPGRASLGRLSLDGDGEGGRVSAPVPHGSPAYRAGLEEDDQLLSVDDTAIGSSAQLDAALAGKAPGDRVTLAFLRRGERVTAEAVLEQDSRVEIVTLESTGGAPSPAQQAFRTRWLSSRLP